MKIEGQTIESGSPFLLTLNSLSTDAFEKQDTKSEQEILHLKKENVQLKKSNQSLNEKCRQLKKQCATLRKSTSAREVKATTTTNPSSSSSERTIVSALRKRLVASEKQILTLQNQLEQHHHCDAHENENDGDTSNAKSSSSSRESRERQIQLNLLQNQYDLLESKSRAERDIQDRTLGQMEEFNKSIRQLRKDNQKLTFERDHYAKQGLKCTELEQELGQLREQNQRLETRMTSLCESPFINNAFEKKEFVDRMAELEESNVVQKQERQHEREAVEEHMYQLTQELEALRTHAHGLEIERNQMVEQLASLGSPPVMTLAPSMVSVSTSPRSSPRFKAVPGLTLPT